MMNDEWRVANGKLVTRNLRPAICNLLLSYDLYERHFVTGKLLREILREGPRNASVLDVGGRAELLERFTPYRVVSANIDGTGGVLASGDALPFANGAFSAVVSIDTLEHIPSADRLPFLRECMRVARRGLVIAAPFGSEEHRAFERELNELYRSMYNRPHPYLSEHVRYGLPEPENIDRSLRGLGARRVQRLFAGDYVWQGERFKQAMKAPQEQGAIHTLLHIYERIRSLALFHSLRLCKQPYARANRFYLLIEK
jgi:SAM-dependent methyltransferase